MKVECEGCGVLMELEVRPAARGIELVCTACGHVGRLGGGGPSEAAAEVAAAPAALEVVEGVGDALEQAAELRGSSMRPSRSRRSAGSLEIHPGEGPVRCPKCGFRQEETASCHRCGLELARARSEAWEVVAPSQQAAAAEVDAEWAALLAGDFRDRRRHDGFIQAARSRGMLDRAARRYRFFAQDHAGQPAGDVAAGALEQIVEMMHAEFVVSAGSGDEEFGRRVRQFKSALMLAAVVMCVGVLMLAIYIFGPFR